MNAVTGNVLQRHIASTIRVWPDRVRGTFQAALWESAGRDTIDRGNFFQVAWSRVHGAVRNLKIPNPMCRIQGGSLDQGGGPDSENCVDETNLIRSPSEVAAIKRGSHQMFYDDIDRCTSFGREGSRSGLLRPWCATRQPLCFTFRNDPGATFGNARGRQPMWARRGRIARLHLRATVRRGSFGLGAPLILASLPKNSRKAIWHVRTVSALRAFRQRSVRRE